MFSLDVTHQVLTTSDRLEALRAIDTPVCRAAAGMLAYYGSFDAARYGIPGSPLHDPCVIAYLLQPSLFQGKPYPVAVETISELTMGQTIVDLWQTSGQPANAQVMQSANADGFYHLRQTCLSTL